MKSSRRFHYYGFLLFAPAALLCLVCLLLLSRVRINGGGGVLLYVAALLGVFFFGARGWAYWKRPWRYEVDDRYLSADRLSGRQRIEIPWTEIRCVRKVKTQDRFRNWPEIEVQALNGATLLIASNLGGYQQLIKMIHSRAVGCEEFEAHPAWRFGRDPNVQGK